MNIKNKNTYISTFLIDNLNELNIKDHNNKTDKIKIKIKKLIF